jgi:hypothetical protein
MREWLKGSTLLFQQPAGISPTMESLFSIFSNGKILLVIVYEILPCSDSQAACFNRKPMIP